MATKQYLRVTDTWQQMVLPTEDPTYVVNVSGATVKLQLLDTLPLSNENLDEHTFTLGGVISQFKVPVNMYLYAKAVTPIPSSEIIQATIVTDTSYMDISDVNAIQEDINRLAVEVMKLTNRVSDTETKNISQDLDYSIFVREFLDSNNKIHESLAHNANINLTLLTRLMSAETVLSAYRKRLGDIEGSLSTIGNTTDMATKIEELSNSLTRVNTTITNINNLLNNDLIPKVEEGWADYDKLVKENITPLKTDVADLTSDMSIMNNTITRLTSHHTAQEIEAAFAEILATAPEDMVAPLTGVKNALVSIVLLEQETDALAAAVVQKINYTDVLDISSDASVLEASAK